MLINWIEGLHTTVKELVRTEPLSRYLFGIIATYKYSVVKLRVDNL
jgi:hypothetical protein